MNPRNGVIIIIKAHNKKNTVFSMTPSLGAFLSSVILAVLIVVIPISAALVFVSTTDKIVRS